MDSLIGEKECCHNFCTNSTWTLYTWGALSTDQFILNGLHFVTLFSIAPPNAVNRCHNRSYVKVVAMWTTNRRCCIREKKRVGWIENQWPSRSWLLRSVVGARIVLRLEVVTPYSKRRYCWRGISKIKLHRSAPTVRRLLTLWTERLSPPKLVVDTRAIRQGVASGNKFIIVWIPGHAGWKRNEKADKFAKQWTR